MFRSLCFAIILSCIDPVSAKADINQLKFYIEELTTLKSTFEMTTLYSSDIRYGEFYLQRPGRLRFEFDDQKNVIIADGFLIHFIDNDAQDYANNFINATPAQVLLNQTIDLKADFDTTKVDTSKNSVSYKIQSKDNPEVGFVVIHMNKTPYQIKGWTIYDAIGDEINIKLTNIEEDVSIDPRLFVFKAPQADQSPDSPEFR